MQSRGNNVLGINDGQNGDDNLPYATLNYANGPGHRVNMNLGGRQNLNKLHMEDNVRIPLPPRTVLLSPHAFLFALDSAAACPGPGAALAQNRIRTKRKMLIF